jgi:hypothetical protein
MAGNTQDSIHPENKEDLLAQDKYEVLMVSDDSKYLFKHNYCRQNN